jgi:hypothetical protein
MKSKLLSSGLLLLCPIVLLIIASLLYLVYEKVTDPWVIFYGSRTTGTVTDKYEYSSDSSVTIIYTFAPSTEEVFTDSFDFLFSSNLEVGDQIEIAFDSGNPSRSVPTKAGFSLWYFLLLTLIVVVFMLFGCGWFMVWAVRKFSVAWSIKRQT